MALSPALSKMVSQANNKYSTSGSNAIKPKEGRNTFRILWSETAPWIDDDGQFWADQGVHWIKADENGKPIAVVGDCDVCFQEPSVIGVAIEAAIAGAFDEETKTLYESWKSRKSVLLNVLNRTGNADPSDPVVLELTTTTYGKVMEMVEMYAQEGQNILDPEEGIDIVILRTGTGLSTKYDVTVSPGQSRPVPKEVVDKGLDLKNYIRKQFFRGEEQKALNAIAQISGVAVPQLGKAGAATTTPVAALTSSGAVVEDAVIEPEPEAPVVKAKAPVAEVKTEAVDPAVARRAEMKRKQDEMAAEMAAFEKEMAEAAAKSAAAETTAAPAAEPEAEAAPTLAQDEQDAILAELDGIK